MTYTIAFIISAALSFILIPLITRYAHRRRLYDEHDARKIHDGDIPRLGGVGIYFSFLVGFAVAGLVIHSLSASFTIQPVFWVLFAVGFGFHIVGLVDDTRGGLRARFKFGIELALAIIVVAAGYSFDIIEMPFPPYRVELGFLGPVITVLWIIGLANALNLIDGMDGMAGGISLIGAGTWALYFFKTGQGLPAVLSLCICGAIVGFLFFNFPPATIFMGDSGSLFLGYALAVIPLLGGVSGSDGENGLLQAITIGLIPVLDTFAAILRRWRRGVSFFEPDRAHLHHKLLDMGFAPRQILVIIYALCLALGGTVLAGIYASPRLSFYLMMCSWAACGGLFLVIHFLRKAGAKLPRREAGRG